MASRRTCKAVIYKCDKPDCKAQHIAPFNDYKLAWTHAKAEGWRSLNIGGAWRHFCNWIHVPNERTTLDGQAGSTAPDTHGRP